MLPRLIKRVCLHPSNEKLLHSLEHLVIICPMKSPIGLVPNTIDPRQHVKKRPDHEAHTPLDVNRVDVRQRLLHCRNVLFGDLVIRLALEPKRELSRFMMQPGLQADEVTTLRSLPLHFELRQHKIPGQFSNCRWPVLGVEMSLQELRVARHRNRAAPLNTSRCQPFPDSQTPVDRG